MIPVTICICATVLSGLWLSLRYLERTANSVNKDFRNRVERLEMIVSRFVDS